MSRYWIIVASRDHVQRGIAGGFAQANHGKEAPLRRMREGDRIIYYSSKVSLETQEPYQAFTAIGEVVDQAPYQVEVSPDFQPYRRNIRYLPCQEVPIRPLIPQLSFITDKSRWGAAFRFGMLEIPESDYSIIATAMGSTDNHESDS